MGYHVIAYFRDEQIWENWFDVYPDREFILETMLASGGPFRFDSLEIRKENMN